MIQTLSRKEILKMNKSFAKFISDIQDIKYNPATEENKYTEGYMILDEDEEARFVSQDESDIMTQTEYKEYLSIKDNIEFPQFTNKYFGNKVYNLPNNEVDIYVENLAKTIEKFCKNLKWESVLFLLEYPTPWLSQKNSFKPVKNAIKYFKKLGVKRKFIGGFIANGEELKELIQNLFWLTRCNAGLPICYFTGINSKFTANICQYGNIHFEFYSKKSKNQIEKNASKYNLIEIEDGRCLQNFNESRKIKGRKLKTNDKKAELKK